MGAVLAIVGFVVTGQFVSASSLETPYYVTMAGLAMLKLRPARAPIVAPALLGRPLGGVALRTGVVRPAPPGPAHLPIRGLAPGGVRSGVKTAPGRPTR
jgi:hypothetical protein